jgi:hypothetical protein
MDIVAALALTATLFLEFRRDKMNGTEKTKKCQTPHQPECQNEKSM